MKGPPSLAQRANWITFTLKGDLKNVQVAYIRAAAKLAFVRDERLYNALGFASMEAYASARLGLRRAALFRYLQIHDWIRRSHPAWLARRPKGFIPELSDAYALMWIERKLADPTLGPQTRADLEALHRKGVAGKLSDREFEAVRRRGRVRRDSLRAYVTALKAMRRRGERLPEVSRDFLRDFDALVSRLERTLASTRRVARLPSAAGLRLAAVGRQSLRA